jgi:hypothetical protein
LKGISTGDFEEAFGALLGKNAGGLSASTIARLKEAWADEHTRWLDRDLSAKQYVYFCARRTRSRAHSPPFGIERSDRGDVFPIRPLSP